VVLVATVRALKHQGGDEGFDALKEGMANLGKHIEIIRSFGLKPIVALNVFPGDTKKELELMKDFCKEKGAEVEASEGFTKGSNGTTALAEKVVAAADQADGNFIRTYEPEDPVKIKIEKVAKKVYGADGVIFSWEAKRRLKTIKKLGLNRLPVCIAKTPLSLSDNKDKLNVPTGWRLNINNIEFASGAGYVIPISGDIMLMPGLPRVPSAEQIDVDSTGENVTGLF
jgi:formate--tetrahydrofolate ligase